MGENLLADFLKENRQRRKISLRDLAEETGVSYSQLSKIERGLSKPSKETLDKLASALEVDRDQLFALSGVLNKDIQEDVIMSLPTLRSFVSCEDDESNIQGNSFSIPSFIQQMGRVSRSKEKKPLADILCELLMSYNGSLSTKEATSLSREMFATYDKGIRKINVRKKIK